METLLDAVACCARRLSSRQRRRTNFDSVLFSIRFLGSRFEKQIGQSPSRGKDSKIPYAIALSDGGLALSRPLASAVIAIFIIICLFVLPQRAGTHPGE